MLAGGSPLCDLLFTDCFPFCIFYSYYLCTYIFINSTQVCVCVCSAPFNSFPSSLAHMSPPSLLLYSLHGTTYWVSMYFHTQMILCVWV